MPTFGQGKDLRVLGANDAMKDLGLDKNRVTGDKRPKATKAKTIPVSEYSTPGAYQNPKVAEHAIPAPNYRECALKKNCCSTCKHYSKQNSMMGICKKFDFLAKGDQVCDAWR